MTEPAVDLASQMRSLIHQPLATYLVALDDAYQHDQESPDYAKARHDITSSLRHIIEEMNRHQATIHEADAAWRRAIEAKIQQNIELVAHASIVPEPVRASFVAALQKSAALL